jgi:hypothetical protein
MIASGTSSSSGQVALAPALVDKTNDERRWLVLHASRPGGPGTPSQTAIILEPADPMAVAPVILEAYQRGDRRHALYFFAHRTAAPEGGVGQGRRTQSA